MWSAKFTIKDEDSIYTILTKKHKVIDQFYPVNFTWKGKHVHILGIHHLTGTEEAKNAFAKDLKKHRKTVRYERYDDTIIILMREEEKFYELMYNPELYNPTPAIIQDGQECWLVIAFDRSIINTLIAAFQKHKEKFPEFKLHYIQKTTLGEIYFPRFSPALPTQQKIAFFAAVQGGYYTIPRKSQLKDLAKEMGISVSTYQEHLRKAESKLLPFFGREMKDSSK